MTDKFDSIISQLEKGEQPAISVPTLQSQEGLTPVNEGYAVTCYSAFSEDQSGLELRTNAEESEK